MTEVEYDIVKEIPKTTHKFSLGQEVMIIHGARAIKATITGIKIEVDDYHKKVVYLFDELSSPVGQVGREEKDIWEHKQDLVNAIFSE